MEWVAEETDSEKSVHAVKPAKTKIANWGIDLAAPRNCPMTT